MKRIALALCVIAALSLSGCASMWKTMGVATVKSVAERGDKTDAQLAELKRSVDELSVKVTDAQKTVDDVARIEKMVAELQGKVDQLPQDTLRKLADILAKASAELDASAKK